MNNCLKKKGTFLKLPNNSSFILNLSHQNIKSEADLNKSEKSSNNNICGINRSNSFRLNLKNEINNNNISNKTNNIFKRQKVLSSKGIIDIKRINKFSSKKNNFDIKKSKSPIFESRKIKKKGEKINKQLNKISKNIENTSKNINNPGEFYMNLFNNIIAKETQSFNGDDNDNDKNSNILYEDSGNKVKYNSLSGKNSNGEITIVDSIISNKGSGTKDSNKNIIKIKEKKKSIFVNNKI